MARIKGIRVVALLVALFGIALIFISVRSNSQAGMPTPPTRARSPQSNHVMEVPPDAALSGMADRSALPAAPAPNPWVPIGPAPVNAEPSIGRNGYCAPNVRERASGRTTAIGFGSGAPSAIYLGAAGGGVWKSTDNAATWRSLTDFQPVLSVGALSVQPGTTGKGDVIYVGTGESNQAGDNLYGLGILKSTDGGSSWDQLAANTFSLRAFGGLAVIPGKNGNPDTLFAATTQATVGSSTAVTVIPAVVAGVYRSTSGGASWTMLSGRGGLPQGGQVNGSASDVVVDPADSKNVYAAIKCVNDCDNGGVWKSSDGGDNWKQLDTPNKSARMALFISPNGRRLYAANTADGDQFDAVYISTDAGGTWTPGGGLPQVGNSPNCLSTSQADYNLALGADPNNPTTVFVGLIGLYKSTNGGVSWAYSLDRAQPDFHVVKVQGARVWALSDGGLFRSTDGGSTWDDSANVGLGTIQFQGVGLAPASTTLAVGGSQDNGIAVYSGRLAWLDSGIPADGGLGAVATNPKVVFSETQGANLKRSTKSGAPDSFGTITPPLVQGESTQFYVPFSLDPSNSDRLLYGTNRIWESCAVSPQLHCNATSGVQVNWTAISPALNPGCSYQSEQGVTNLCKVTDVRVAPTNPAVVYAVTTSNGGIGPFAWVSTNANRANPIWSNISAGLPAARGLTSLSISPANAGTVIVSVQGFTGGGRHIFLSTSFGKQWRDITTAATRYPDLPTLKVLYDPFDKTGNTIYVGTTVGVLRSGDNGASWANFNANSLPNVQVFDLQRNSQMLVAGTHGRSAWAMMMPVATPTATAKATDKPTPKATATLKPTPKPTPTK
jgi:photosystem II stability/assembly factor-like uncharacterized protein